MKSKLLAGMALGLILSSLPETASALNVTTSNDGSSLANALIGSGISIVNGSVSYSGANSGASGIFTNGGNVGISNGVLLTTGSAAGAVGPNNSSSYSGGGAATSLAFDFITTGGSLFFNYVFASEEYNEYVGSQFNDYFKFYLDGENIALIPNSNTGVAINNVNSGLNSAYYVNNSPGSIDTQYDGLTTVLTAQKLGLTQGSQHHMELYITDVGDSAWDSAVFIQGNSFSDTPNPVPEPSTFILLGAGLAGLGMYRRRTSKK